MPRPAKPFLSRGNWITTVGGKQTRLATEAEGEEAAKARLAELLAAKVAVPQVAPLTVRELFSRFMEHARIYYRLPSGERSGEVDAFAVSCRELLAVAGSAPAASLTRHTLRDARSAMLARGLARKTINQRTGRIRHLIKWAAAEDLIPVQVLAEVSLVEPLPAGRSAAPEYDAIEPVEASTVAATLPELAEPWRSMVRLQWVTGMRPGEVCSLRASYLYPTGRMTLLADYGKFHKMAYRGKVRRIRIGVGGTLILSRWLGLALMRGVDHLFFTPRIASPVERRQYTAQITQAAKRAGVPHWHPNQIRHSFGTRVRAVLGLDAAQVALGHSKADITQVYAKLDDSLGDRVADMLG